MKRQRGIGLVVVLWGVLLLAVLTAAIVALSRTENRLVSRHLEAARHMAAVHTAIAWAAQRLLDTRPQTRLPIDGSPITLEFAGQRMEVGATLEAGRIDLNSSPDELLGVLFRSQGLSGTEADQWLARLRDWQDRDDERRPGGAEWADYRAAGLPYGPRNGPLKSVEEVELLVGMPARLARCIEAATTVYSGIPVPDVFHLAPETRRILAWADQREMGSRRWLPETKVTPSESAPLAGQVIRLRIKLFDKGNDTPYVSEVIGRLLAGRGRHWLTIALRSGEREDRPDCDLTADGP